MSNATCKCLYAILTTFVHDVYFRLNESYLGELCDPKSNIILMRVS